VRNSLPIGIAEVSFVGGMHPRWARLVGVVPAAALVEAGNTGESAGVVP